jgi:hypothetical protein
MSLVRDQARPRYTPLTRVNKCIRRESLAMYYESVKSNPLGIPLHDPTDFAQAKQLLPDLDTNLHQVKLASWTHRHSSDFQA